MYCDKWVNRRLDAAQSALAADFSALGYPRHTLTYRTVSEVDAFESHLRDSAKLTYDDKGSVVGTVNLAPDEVLWTLNEQALVKCDAAYALTRYCNPPETPIWMGDYSFKYLGDVRVGDEVMGWERVERVTKGARNKTTKEVWKRSRVLAIARRVAPLVKVTMASGDVIRCTPDHLWSSGNHDKGKVPWIRVRPGWRLRKATKVYGNFPPSIRDAAWLGGVYDGEGSHIYIAQSKAHNPDVHAAILQTLTRLGFDCCEHLSGETIGIRGGVSAYARFLLWCKPVRRRHLDDYIFKRHSTLMIDRDLIVSVEPDGDGEVISMETSTGNYVAWGYLSKNCKLIDEEAVVRRFAFRLAQRLLFNVISDLEDLDVAIEIMILKARQLGMTTVVQLLILLRIAFGYGVNAVAASAEKEKSGLMAKKLFMAYDMMPVWLKPRPTARSEEGDNPKLVFGQLNTTLSIQHGRKMTGGVAQSWTPIIYHLTECALFPNANDQINMGLWKAVHASPNVLGILESTGAGDTGWWADTWRYSKEHWQRRECRMCPVFLPWFIGREIYPKPAWLRARPIPDGWYSRRLPATREHVARAELYVHSEPILRKYLGERWSMPLEQQWFWEVGHQEAAGTSAESTWYQEMAGDDTEALQRSVEGVFAHDVITEVEERAASTQAAMSLYGIVGQSIEDRHEPHPDDIDYGTADHPSERIAVKWKSIKSDVTYRWELIPLRHDLTLLDSLRRRTAAFRAYSDCKLVVFHPPQRGVLYTIGGDTASGQGNDSTVFSVMAVGRDGSPDIQCAEFGSAWVSHVEAYAFCMAIAAWYGQFAESPIDLPLISVEQLKAVGDICQSEMRKMGYPVGRFFDFGRYDGRKLKQVGNRKGWYTTGWSRPILCGNFIHVVRNNWCQINSPWAIEEMKNWEVHYTAAGAEKMEHAEAYWDDRIFASAIATFTSHDMESQTERTKKKFMGASATGLPPIDVRDYADSNAWATKPNESTRMITDLNDLPWRS